MTAVLNFTRPHVLRTEEEYDEAVRMLDELLDRDPEAGTEQHDLLEFLSVLIEAYEATHYPDEMFATTPQDVVDFVLQQKGMQRATWSRSSAERAGFPSSSRGSGNSRDRRSARSGTCSASLRTCCCNDESAPAAQAVVRLLVPCGAPSGSHTEFRELVVQSRRNLSISKEAPRGVPLTGYGLAPTEKSTRRCS